MRARRTAIFALLALVFTALPARAQHPSPTPGFDRALASELVRRMAVDQAGRDSLAIAVTRNDTAFAHRLMARDSESTNWLRGVVARHGWPGKSLVGDSGAEAAFLLLQHSPDEAFQAALLPQLWKAARSKEIPASAVVMLDDRVAVHAGRPQTYGTSFAVRDSCLTPDRIAEPATVDVRRAKVGLPSLAEYAEMLGKMYRMPVSLTGSCHRP